MRKILSLIVISIHLMSGVVFGASEWAKTEPTGSQNASDLDYYIADINNEAIDRLVSGYRENCVIYYVSATSIGVKAGEVVCSDGSTNKFRRNTTATTEDIQTEVTGAGTYNVFAIADADATTFTLEVDSNATPSVGTHYKKLGSFYASADNVVANDDGLINDNNYYALRLGDWISKSDKTSYQASSDGFVIAYTVGGDSLIIYSDTSNPPTTIRAATDTSGEDAFASIPIKRGDYWKTVGQSASATVWWIPLEREV